jgi:hypothetical protein
MGAVRALGQIDGQVIDFEEKRVHRVIGGATSG